LIDNSYGIARDNAKEILLYSWNQFDQKTNEYFDKFNEKPLSNTDPKGENGKSIDVDAIVIGLREVKIELHNEINKIIDKSFYDDQTNEYFDEDLEWTDNRIRKAKKIGITWFQRFVIKKGLSSSKYENIYWLWDNFTKQNLWIRYHDESNFKDMRDKGKIIEWYKSNNNHLLSCYHDAIYTIIQMRNTAEHYETNHYATKLFNEIKEEPKDPITEVDKSFFNCYTLFTSLSNMIIGLLRSLQIFEESLKFSLIDNSKNESEIPKIKYYIICPECANEFSTPFEPNIGWSIQDKYGCSKSFVLKEEHFKDYIKFM
jgi:hypothetical protein